MTKIYQVYTNLSLEIKEVECLRITDNSYWTMNNRRNHLDTNYLKSFLNKEDAISYLRGKLNAKIYSLKSTCEYYENELSKFKSLYEQPCETK
jgi:hypothetical protein